MEKGSRMAKSLRASSTEQPATLGNVQAAAKGPSAYGRRVVRRKTYAKTNGALSKITQIAPQVDQRCRDIPKHARISSLSANPDVPRFPR